LNEIVRDYASRRGFARSTMRCAADCPVSRYGASTRRGRGLSHCAECWSLVLGNGLIAHYHSWASVRYRTWSHRDGRLPLGPVQSRRSWWWQSCSPSRLIGQLASKTGWPSPRADRWRRAWVRLMPLDRSRFSRCGAMPVRLVQEIQRVPGRASAWSERGPCGGVPSMRHGSIGPSWIGRRAPLSRRWP